jgi:hypothetical protein
MSLNKMTDTIIDTTQHRAVKIAGIFFILNLLVPLFNWTLVLNKFNVPENILATASNIISNELLFRIGITVELLMSVGLIVLALALYKILKPVNKTLSLFALLLKFIEATLMTVTVVIPFVALQFLTANASMTVFSLEQLQFPIGVIFHAHTAITAIPMVFLGLDMMIFSYLFFKSNYVPRIISCFGIISFALIFIHALMFILAPEFATMPINQIIFWTPSGLFEIIIGGWLLIKGIMIQ